jgi:hypothetical protein
MSWLDRLRGRARSRVEKREDVPAEDPACAHVVLVPRWDSTGDMGHDDRASSWVCDACGASFTPSEAQTVRANEAERVKSALRPE